MDGTEDFNGFSRISIDYDVLPMNLDADALQGNRVKKGVT